jgi:KDO2-lipid IV(A) lauroyltransferase
MSKKHKSKKNFLLDTFVPAIHYLPAKTVPFLPLSLVRFIGHFLFITLYPITIVTGLRKRFAINIANVFQKKTDDPEVKKIARQTIHNWIMNIAEIYHFYHSKRRERLINSVTIEGLDKIKQMKKKNVGIIGISAHFGNFPLMIFRLNIEDINMSFLFKEVAQESIASIMSHYMNNIINLKMIIPGNLESPTNGAINEIKNAGFVIFIADEFKKRSGVEVKFFNKSTMQAIGPSIISIKTKAPILQIFIIRERRSRHRIVVEDPIHYELTGDTSKDILALTQKRMEIIEKYIKQYPDLWLWVHSRWVDKNKTN